MRNEFAKLRRNLAAGLRLVFFMPVSRLEFRIDVAQLVLLFVLSALIDFGADWVRYGPDAYFTWYGAGNELFAGGVVMLFCTLIALASRRGDLVVAIPVVALSSFPALQVLFTVPAALSRWTQAPVTGETVIDTLGLAWVLLLFIRSVAVALGPGQPWRWPRAAVGGLLLATPIWFSSTFTPTHSWWEEPTIRGVVDPRYPSPASEAVLAAQAELLDNALAAIEDETPGNTDLYFVAFAGDAGQNVFRKDAQLALKVMDERWGTGGKSLALINNPRTLLDTPIATVSNLRAALTELGSAINPDQDVVMLYFTSHGRRDHTLEISLPPLELAQLSPTALRTMLDDAGIRWRIIVVSACYSGGFISALEDAQTIVMTASQSDRTSFGCGSRSDATYFGEALFEQGLARFDSMLTAFEIAKKRVAEREAASGFKPPSNPQISVGSAMAEKLKELERGGAARRTGRSV
jgi:hypothetical protein